MVREPALSCCLRESSVSASPSLYQAMLGVGLPEAAHASVVVVARTVVVLLGCDENCGDVCAVCEREQN